MKSTKAKSPTSRRYELLKTRLRDLGYICVGTITRRRLTCGKATCICRRDSSRLHGPYFYWTRKVSGRTQSLIVDESSARLFEEGIQNHKRLNAIIKEMRKLSLSTLQDRRGHSPG